MASPLDGDVVLKEYRPLTHILQKIPRKAQCGIVNIINICLTCIDVNSQHIALGSNIGAVFLYDRQKQDITRLKGESYKQSVTCIKLHSGLNEQIAFGTDAGNIDIFQLPSKLVGHSRQLERFHIDDIHSSKVTCLHWSTNGQKLFSGDSSGVVVSTDVDFLQSVCKSEELLQEEIEVVQLDYNFRMLLISTLLRTVICHTNQANSIVQVGTKERRCLGNFGACFSSGALNANEVLLYAARPGLRIWEANGQGVVESTYIFKDTIGRPQTSIPLLKEEAEITPMSACKFAKLALFSDDQLISWNASHICVLYPAQNVVVATQSTLGHIADVAVNSNEIFVLRHNCEPAVIRIASDVEPYIRDLPPYSISHNSPGPQFGPTESFARNVSLSTVIHADDLKKSDSPLQFLQKKINQFRNAESPTSPIRIRAKIPSPPLISQFRPILLAEDEEIIKNSEKIEVAIDVCHPVVSCIPAASNAENNFLVELPPVVDLLPRDIIKLTIDHENVRYRDDILDDIGVAEIATGVVHVPNDIANEIDPSESSPTQNGALEYMAVETKTSDSKSDVRRSQGIGVADRFAGINITEDDGSDIVFAGSHKQKAKKKRPKSDKMKKALAGTQTLALPILYNTQISNVSASESDIYGSYQSQSSIASQRDSLDSAEINFFQRDDVLLVNLEENEIKTDVTSATGMNEKSDMLNLQPELENDIHPNDENNISEDCSDNVLTIPAEIYHTDEPSEKIMELGQECLALERQITGNVDNIITQKERMKFHERRLNEGLSKPSEESDAETINVETYDETNNVFDSGSQHGAEDDKSTENNDSGLLESDEIVTSNELVSCTGDSAEKDDSKSVDTETKSGNDPVYDIYRGSHSRSMSIASQPKSPIPTCEPTLIVEQVDEIEQYSTQDDFEVFNLRDDKTDIWADFSPPAAVQSLAMSNRHIWLTDRNDHVFYSALPGLGLSWIKLDISAKHVSVSPSGNLVWVLCKDSAFAALSVSSRRPAGTKWAEVARGVSSISLDDNCVWYIKHNGEVRFQKNLTRERPMTKSYPIPCNHRLVQIACRNGVTWALTDKYQLVARIGVTAKCPEGTDWLLEKQEGIYFCAVMPGDESLGWGVDFMGSLWFCCDVSTGFPLGNRKWWQVQLSPYITSDSSDMSAVDKMKSLAGMFDSLLKIQETRLLCASKRGLWLCSGNKHRLQLCRCAITGHCWKIVELSGIASSARWRLVTATRANLPNGIIWTQQPNGDIFTFSASQPRFMVVQPPHESCIFECISACASTVWCLTQDGRIFIRNIAGSRSPIGVDWTHLDTSQLGDAVFVHLSCGGQTVWAVAEDGNVYQRIGTGVSKQRRVNQAWVPVDSNGIGITNVYTTNNDWMVWAIDNHKRVYVRLGITDIMPIGTEWVSVPGIQANMLSVSETHVWALTPNCDIVCRYGILPNNLVGDYWRKIPGSPAKISVSARNELWGINKNGQLIQRSTNIVQTNASKENNYGVETSAVPSGASSAITSTVSIDDNEWEYIC